MQNYLQFAARITELPLTKFLVLMKMILILLTVGLLQVGHAANAQHVTLQKKDASLEALLKELHQQTGYFFLGSSQLYALAKPISVDIDNQPIESALARIFDDQPLIYEISEKTVYIRKRTTVQEFISLSGVVGDTLGRPLPNATIRVVDHGKATFSTQNGSFVLHDVPVTSSILISFIGYQTRIMAATADFSVADRRASGRRIYPHRLSADFAGAGDRFLQYRGSDIYQ